MPEKPDKTYLDEWLDRVCGSFLKGKNDYNEITKSYLEKRLAEKKRGEILPERRQHHRGNECRILIRDEFKEGEKL